MKESELPLGMAECKQCTCIVSESELCNMTVYCPKKGPEFDLLFERTCEPCVQGFLHDMATSPYGVRLEYYADAAKPPKRAK